MEPSFWDKRFQEQALAYGESANDFVMSTLPSQARGKLLDLGAGQGRNAIYAATLGYAVTAVDQSPIGLERAQREAARASVSIDTVAADLTDYDIGSGWDVIMMIFLHLAPAARADVLAKASAALRPGGLLILEGYRPQQLAAPGKGGPPDASFMYTSDEVKAALPNFQFDICRAVEREVNEGPHHAGVSATLQVAARKT